MRAKVQAFFLGIVSMTENAHRAGLRWDVAGMLILTVEMFAGILTASAGGLGRFLPDAHHKNLENCMAEGCEDKFENMWKHGRGTVLGRSAPDPHSERPPVSGLCRSISCHVPGRGPLGPV